MRTPRPTQDPATPNQAQAPRLFILLARDAPLGLILRRGPSKWCHLILWDTRRDVFTNGAWFRGRIYEDKCDLSPDGTLLVYAVHQGHRLQTSYTSSYTAVSRPPWLHALALWPMATTYGGGGRFMDDKHLSLRVPWRNGSLHLHPDHPPGGLPTRRLDVTAAPMNLQSHRSADEVIGADWSGRDHGNHLVHATGGRLFRRTGNLDIEIADFNGLIPSPSPAPAWAKRPL